MKKIKKKTILVIGGTGFIGYHLIKKCIKMKWSVTSISTTKPKKYRKLKKVNYLICDVSKKNLLNKKLNNNIYNYVVNLSGYVDHSDKSQTFKSHYIGCKNLADFFTDKEISSFVQIGSSSEYGRVGSPQKEESSCKPLTIYGKSKFLATKYLNQLYKKNKFPFTVLRIYQAYGPKQDFNRFIPIVIKACIKNKLFPCSHGKQYRDFTYVDDIINAIIFSLKSYKSKGKIINIGTGRPKQIKAIIKKIRKKLRGGKPQFGLVKLRKDEILSIYPNLRNAKNLINWSSKVTLDEGLNKTMKFYLKELKKREYLQLK